MTQTPMLPEPEVAPRSKPTPPSSHRRGMGLGRMLGVVAVAVVLSVMASLLAVTAPGPDTTDEDGSVGMDAAAEAAPVSADRISRDPTDVGQPVGDRGPTTVNVELETVEAQGQLADGTAYDYWTFNGTVPGPMIRARVGDTIEMTFRNSPDADNIHSIDLHAVNGPGGGAEVTQVAPGEEATFSFKALNPGVYVYHCASPHVPSHIANGMYGLIVVEPEGGLPEVDRELYVMQGEIYTDQERGAQGLVAYDGDAMIAEDPTYVVFNGAANALTDDYAMQADVGDRVRLFVGNGGPNLTSSFHVIGEIFDRVHDQGASEASTNVQTTLIPAGGAAWTEFTVDEPGDYLLVDHALTRTIDKGALAVLTVAGDRDPAIYDGTFPEEDAEVSDSGADQAAEYAPGDTIPVSMTEFAYHPENLELSAGTYTFAVTNDGAAPHEWMLATGAEHDDHFAETRELAAGETQEVEVTLEEGTYEYACHIPGHYEAGMKGTLTVVD